jgi:hypothetical protein
MRSMRRRVREHDVAHWAQTFLSTLDGSPANADAEHDAGAEHDGDASTGPGAETGPGAAAY